MLPVSLSEFNNLALVPVPVPNHAVVINTFQYITFGDEDENFMSASIL